MFHVNRSLICPGPVGVLLAAAVVLFGCSARRAEPGMTKAKRADLSLAMLDVGDFTYRAKTVQQEVSLPRKFPVGACTVAVHSLHGLGRLWATSGAPVPELIQNVFELRRTDPITFVANLARVASDPKCQQAGFLPVEVRLSRSTLSGLIDSVEVRDVDPISGPSTVTNLATECFLSILIYTPIDSSHLDSHADLKEYVAKIRTRLAALNKSSCPKL